MERKSEKVAGLTLKAVDFLSKGDADSAEVYYKHALAEGIRLLGLRHPVTRDALSFYSLYLRAFHRDEEAIRFEALYWKTACPGSYRLGVLFGGINSDVQDFLQKNADWVENWGRQMSLDSQHHEWGWNWVQTVIVNAKAYFLSLRQHVVELSK
jgi:hypothetical protein